MIPVSVLLQQIKEKEERDLAYAKKIKEGETIIKCEQEKIKNFNAQRSKLSEELKRKYLNHSEKEVTEELLQQQTLIWLHLLEKSRAELREEEAKLEELQQGVCLNRLAFYNEIKEFLDKHELIHSSSGYFEKYFSPVNTNPTVKTEHDTEEYSNIMEEIVMLENQLEDLKIEEAEIEEAKRMKVQLEAEPSCGDEFIRIQKTLKETKNALKNAEDEIKNMKTEIAQKEIELLKRKTTTSTQVQPTTSQDFHTESQKTYSVSKDTKITKHTKDLVQKDVSMSKTVTFQDTVQTKQYPSQTNFKCILKSRKFSPKSPSPYLRNKLSNKQTSKLDEAMKDILFKDKMI